MSQNIEVECASIEQRTILENLIQLYIYDFTEYVPMTLRPDGRFEYSRLSLYWAESGRHPFIIRADGRLAGFALVTKGSDFSGNKAVWDMAEFFVLRGERGRGVGYAGAANIWRQLPGPWEVRVMPDNLRALQFWRTSIAHFLDRPVEPVQIERGDESRTLFLFESPA